MIYGVLLAAGLSSRMGQPKQLLQWQGQPLIAHVVAQACSSRLDGLIVVTGAAAEATAAVLSGVATEHAMPVSVCFNPDYAQGQATSLRAGLAELPPDARAAVVLLVDQPLITPTLINRMLDAYAQHPAMLAIVPTYQGQRGNPVLLAQPLFAAVQQIEGDRGARQVLQQHAADVLWLEVDDPAVVQDMDTPQAYRDLQGSP